jgi:hypothetical protein
LSVKDWDASGVRFGFSDSENPFCCYRDPSFIISRPVAPEERLGGKVKHGLMLSLQMRPALSRIKAARRFCVSFRHSAMGF